MLSIDFAYPPGNKLAISIKQLATGLFFDFGAATPQFSATPSQRTAPLPEASAPDSGTYTLQLPDSSTLPAVFDDGGYVILVYDAVRLAASEVAAVAVLGATMKGGDDGTKGLPTQGTFTGTLSYG